MSRVAALPVAPTEKYSSPNHSHLKLQHPTQEPRSNPSRGSTQRLRSAASLENCFVDGARGHAVADLGVQLFGVDDGVGQSMPAGDDRGGGDGGTGGAEAVFDLDGAGADPAKNRALMKCDAATVEPVL